MVSAARKVQPGAGPRRAKPSPARVAAYARVAPDTQAEAGLSSADQLAAIRVYAAARGWTVVSEFVDAGSPGPPRDRPGLQALLAAAEQGACDVVVVHQLSRLSGASVYDTFAIFERLGRCQVGFAAVTEPQFDFANPTGRALLTLIAAVNQYYTDARRAQARQVQRARAGAGRSNAAVLPFGYARGGSPHVPPVIVPAEAEVVRFVFERYVTGRYSLRDIAGLLNARGWRTRTGRPFSKDTVTGLIRNPYYAGQVVYPAGRQPGDGGEVFAGQHEPIIAAELWDASVAIRRRHQARARVSHAGVRPYLLSQLARCHICGRSLRAQGLKSGDYYRELADAQGCADCPNARIGARTAGLHAQVGAVVRLLELPAAWQAELAEMLAADDGTSALADRRAQLTAERRRVQEAYSRGDFAADADQQSPPGEGTRQVKPAAALPTVLAEVWDDAEVGDQRDLLHLMLRDVRVDVAQGRLQLLYPTAPFVPLFRAIPLLAEREAGSFVPVWTSELARAFGLPALPAVAEPLADSVAAPFLPAWPWPNAPAARISPFLSTILKARRAAGLAGGRCVTVPQPGVPAAEVDRRKWSDVTLQALPLAEALALPAGSLACLDTPLAVPEQAALEALVGQVYAVLAPNGYWHFVDLMPASMPAHWVFTYFPAAWAQVQAAAWTPHTISKTLRAAGLGLALQEHTFYQPISLAAAYAVAARRTGILATMVEADYQQGLAQLAAAVRKAGGETLSGSEVTLVEVAAARD